jgi:hypothetical protein
MLQHKNTTAQYKANLLSRWKAEWDGIERFTPAKTATVRALDFVDRVQETHAKIFGKPDPNLSPLGRSNKFREFLNGQAHEVRRARKAVETMGDEIGKWRASLQPPKPDPADMAGAILRAQMRDFVRGLRGGERIGVLLDPNADSVLHAAVLEAPNILSGITDDTRKHIVTAAIERAHPGQLAEIAQAEDVHAMVKAASSWAQMTAQKAADFGSELAFENG